MAKNLLSKIIKKQEPLEIDFSIIANEIQKGHVEAFGKSYVTKKNTFAPSKIVYGEGHCARYWYLAFEGGNLFENKNDGTSIANMNSGTDAHNRIEKALANSSILEWSEEYVSCEDPPINGKMDALLKVNEEYVAMELKTTRDDVFNYHKQNNHATGYHIEQVLIYMKVLNLKYGVIVYENKNTHEIFTVPVTVTQERKDFINYLFDWMRDVRKAFDEKHLPERAYRKNSKVCQSCPLEKVCDERDPGVIKIERRKEIGK
jgi:CRISPR/Cas system-associated exonuclease Cas4 (RecB family)